MREAVRSFESFVKHRRLSLASCVFALSFRSNEECKGL